MYCGAGFFQKYWEPIAQIFLKGIKILGKTHTAEMLDSGSSLALFSSN